MNKLPCAALAMSLLLALGCDDGTTTDPVLGHGPLSFQMVRVAEETDDIVEGVFDSMLSAVGEGGSEVITVDTMFEFFHRCPAAGRIISEGVIHYTWDPAVPELEATLTGSRGRIDCVFFRDGLRITVNGTAQFNAYRHRISERPDGPQTTSTSGSFTAVRSDGEQRSCDFSIEVVRDPTAHSRSLDAWICGDRFTWTTSWTPGDGQ